MSSFLVGRDNDAIPFTGEPVVPRKANSIHVTVLSSDLSFCQVFELEKRVRERLLLSGRLTVVGPNDDPDIELRVTCLSLVEVPLSYNNVGVATSKRMTVTVHAVLVEKKTSRVIFDDREVKAFLEYSEVTPPVKSSHVAREELASILARRLERKTITGWYTELMSDQEKGKAGSK